MQIPRHSERRTTASMKLGRYREPNNANPHARSYLNPVLKC